MQYEINTALGGMSVRTLQVLILEDEWLHMEIMKKMLKKLGFEKITPSSTGEAALQLIKQQKFDLIFTDGNLPSMDGLTFVAHLQDHFEREAYSAPIIMLTGNRESIYVMRAKEAGVDQFIAKPFNMQTLRDKIEAAFMERKPMIMADRKVVTQQVIRPS